MSILFYKSNKTFLNYSIIYKEENIMKHIFQFIGAVVTAIIGLLILIPVILTIIGVAVPVVLSIIGIALFVVLHCPLSACVGLHWAVSAFVS